MDEKRTVAKIKSIGYDVISGEIELSLEDHPRLLFVRPEDIKAGGKNLEIKDLVVGGKIEYVGKYGVTRYLHNVTVISDKKREVDQDGNLIKW